MSKKNVNNKLKKIISAGANREVLERYLSEKGKRHNCFKHYTTMNSIRRIIDERKIILTDGNSWNDLCDSSQLNLPSYHKKYFATCFSFSVSESVPMWMLYGGLRNNGAMLNFGRSTLERTVANKEISLYKKREDGEWQYIKELRSSDVEMWLTDVLYYKEEKGETIVKRSDERAELKEPNILDQSGEYRQARPYFKKEYPWRYENEVRLVVSVPRAMLGDEQRCALKVSLACNSSELENCITVFEYQSDFPNYKISPLKFKMNWYLCSNCEYRI